MGILTAYNKRLLSGIAKKHLWATILGTVEDWPIWLLRTEGEYNKRKPHVLITSGFHGEEKAGPLALLTWLENKKIPDSIDIAFIPVVNPVGFDVGQRYNNKNKKTNCGFCHPELGDAPSDEGQILIANEKLLKKLSINGFLDLHEDLPIFRGEPPCKEFYMYVYENREEPSKFAKAMRDVEDRFFPRYGDGNGVVTDPSTILHPERNIVKDAIVFNLCDGSYEDFRMHEGCPHAIAVETPGAYRLSKRIAAQMALIDKFIELTIEEKYGKTTNRS